MTDNSEHITNTGFVRRVFKIGKSNNEFTEHPVASQSVKKRTITVTRTEQIYIPYNEHISSLCHTAKNLLLEY